MPTRRVASRLRRATLGPIHLRAPYLAPARRGPRKRPPQARAAAGRVNLLDPDEGGKLIAANEENWRRLLAKEPTSTTITSHGFAVFAFRDEKPALIDTLAVFVDSTSGYNVKEMALYATDKAETGPFVKVGEVQIPNYRNMRTPFHEFKLGPFTARYVKVEIVSWQQGEPPNGYVGTIRLYGTVK